MTVGILVDTSVWSLGLRRGSRNPEYSAELKKLILEYRVKIIGPIRQEVLSGISIREQFIDLKNKLSSFVDVPLVTEHYEFAAELSNECRSKGIQGSHVDFLICAVSKLEKLTIFTTDMDFDLYSTVVGLSLYRTIR